MPKTQTGYQAVGKVVETLIETKARVAVAYLSEKFVIRASRQVFKGRLMAGKSTTILVTMGKPNYEAREFIKKCKLAKEPFPVKKIQLKFPPKK